MSMVRVEQVLCFALKSCLMFYVVTQHMELWVLPSFLLQESHHNTRQKRKFWTHYKNKKKLFKNIFSVLIVSTLFDKCQMCVQEFLSLLVRLGVTTFCPPSIFSWACGRSSIQVFRKDALWMNFMVSALNIIKHFYGNLWYVQTNSP